MLNALLSHENPRLETRLDAQFVNRLTRSSTFELRGNRRAQCLFLCEKVNRPLNDDFVSSFLGITREGKR